MASDKSYTEALTKASSVGLGLGPDTPGYTENFFKYINQKVKIE